METIQFENGSEKEKAEAFLLRVSEEAKKEVEKFQQMDGDKIVEKDEYEEIERQGKRTAFLKAMEYPAKMYAEAVSNNDTETAELMKSYLNI